VSAGGGAVYSTTSDMARYVSAVLGGGANRHGSVLRPETLARMFEPHYQPDPRIPGMGLGFFRDQAGGHPTVGHDGDLDRLSLRHGARSRRGSRCHRVRQHRAVQPLRRAGARRQRGPPSPPRPPRRRRAYRRPRATLGLEPPVRLVFPRSWGAHRRRLGCRPCIHKRVYCATMGIVWPRLRLAAGAVSGRFADGYTPSCPAVAEAMIRAVTAGSDARSERRYDGS
jgi:hypothetical protein